ncbi:hypothetical protein DFH06DRAFT_1319356 [Mycena polygramma]|nr:hypothetical protein DFH06DRAFT_1319356 [Mycena polygramma]
MDEEKIDGYLWLGIHPSLRKELYISIRTLSPTRDTAKAPTVAQIKTAAEEYFKRDQFPATLLDAREYGYHGFHDSDSESSRSNSDSSSSSSDSGNDDSDSGSDKKWKHRFKEKLAAKKGRRSKRTHKDQGKERKAKLEVTHEEDRTTKFGKETNEVEEIIERLNTMNIRDPHYGAVYYKALKMDPLVANCIQREPLKIKENVPSGNPPFQRQNPPHMENKPRQSWNVEASGPATYPNNIQPGERQYTPGCFGCGNEDHRINQCSAIINLTERGIIRRNPETQRFTMRDGYAIRRQGTETLVQAAERQGRPVSMLWKQAPILQDAGTELEKQVMGFYWNTKGKQHLHEASETGSEEEDYSEVESEWDAEENEATTTSSDSEFEEEVPEVTSSGENNVEVLESDDETGYDIFQVWAPAEQNLHTSADVYEAERTMPTTRAARKLAFDGVLMPPLKPGLKPKNRAAQIPNKSPKRPEGKKPAKPENASVPDPEDKGRTLKRHSMPEKKKITMEGVPVQAPYDARNTKETERKGLDDIEMTDTVPPHFNIRRTEWPPDRQRQGEREAYQTTHGEHTRTVQFLNRDTFGKVGPAQRSGQGLTSYQVLYNAAATVREEYRQGEPPECNPLSVTSAQTEYLGIERDPYGREGHAFALLNADITGHNSDLEEPFSLNGHAKIMLFTPPPAPGTPWALEAPYPSRSAIRYILQDYRLPNRPFYAFPLHSTSILPSLDFLHPPAPPIHPPGIEIPVNPERIPSPSPNFPRLTTRVPAIEADTREIGRTINDSAISHFVSQLPVSYDYIHRNAGESSSDVELSWDYTGMDADGTRTWRRAKHPGPVAWRRPMLPDRSRLLIPCDDDGIPEVPDDASNCSPWYDELPLNSRLHYLLEHSHSPDQLDPTLPKATVVQIPDPEDRFSRPVERYSVPVYDETDYDRLARVAADLARGAHEWGPRIILDSWQERHIAHRHPQPEVLRPTLDPSLTAKKPQTARPSLSPTSDNDISSPSSSNSDLEYLQYCADLDSNGSTGSDDDASSTGVIWILSPSFLEDGDRPSRPSEEGDSYFPLTLPTIPIAPSRDPRRRNPELPGGRPLMSYPSVDALLQRGPNPILPGGRPIFHSSLSTDSMPALQSVSNSSDDEEDDSDRGEELVTAPTPDPWDDNSSEESVQFSSDEDVPLFDSELQYPPSPFPRPVLCLRTPSLHLGSMPSPQLTTLLLPLDGPRGAISSPAIAVLDDSAEPPLLSTDGQARMRWISRVLNEESYLKRPSSPSTLTHTPLLRALSLSPPLPDASSLINLPSTTPLLRPASPPLSTRVLRRFTQAALTGAEHVLRNITTAVQTSPAQNLDHSYQQLDERIRDLERALLTSLTSSPPPLRDPSTRFPFDEDLDEWTTTSNQLAEILAEHLKEPRIFRAEIPPIRGAELLLGFSQGITDDDAKSYHSFSALSEPYTPCPSPVYSSIEPYTPCPSPTYSLPEEYISPPSPTSLFNNPLSDPAPTTESPITEEEFGPATDEEQQWADRIFDFEFDFDSDVSTQDSESAAARKWLGHEQMEWITEWTADKSIRDDEVSWAPPTRRPMRNECGIVTYDRRRYGVVDRSEVNTTQWNWDDRRRFETIGYALEFLDHFVLFSQSHLEPQLRPNLHTNSFNATEQRLRTLEAAGIRTQQARIATPPCSPSPSSDSRGTFYMPNDESSGFPRDPMGMFLRFLQRVEQEYAADVQLSPITRASRYIPIPASTHFHDISPPDAEEVPAKRRKVEDSPLSQHVLQAETFKAAILSWQPRFPELRILRGDVKHGIFRLIEAVNFLGLRDRFRAIFFPFTECFEVFTLQEMLCMELERNPDGYFRRNSYHLNSLLHDAEANFLQSCAILFRQEEFYDLAYCIEELLATRFYDDIGIAQLLKDGFLDARLDDPEAIANQSYGTLADRLREMVDDWYPDNRARTYC